MEELKLLIEMVSHLPAMAMWVLVGFFAYKVVIIGSIYGVIRLAIVKAHSWLTTPKSSLKVEDVELRARIDAFVITTDGSHDALVAQIHRVRGRGLSIKSDYIHRQSVEWLREAIDEKIAQYDERVTGAIKRVA